MTIADSRVVAWQWHDDDFQIVPSKEKQRRAAVDDSFARWYNRPLVPLSLLAEAERERDAFKQHCDLLTHKVITCGVAAQNPDATLTTRGAFATKWDSPQAQHVRKLRAERDSLQSRLDVVEDVVQIAINTLVISCRPAGNVDVDDAAEIRAAIESLYNLRTQLENGRSAALGCATTGEEG